MCVYDCWPWNQFCIAYIRTIRLNIIKIRIVHISYANIFQLSIPKMMNICRFVCVKYQINVNKYSLNVEFFHICFNLNDAFIYWKLVHNHIHFQFTAPKLLIGWHKIQFAHFKWQPIHLKRTGKAFIAFSLRHISHTMRILGWIWQLGEFIFR